MSVSYDIFTNAFLSKITDFEFCQLADFERQEIVDEYMRRTISYFNRLCKYDLISSQDNNNRVFNIDINETDIDEISDIISEGMVVQWLKPYVYKQELLENAINTKDFSTYSPAELLMRIGNAYKQAQDDYTQMIREYSYNVGNISELHL